MNECSLAELLLLALSLAELLLLELSLLELLLLVLLLSEFGDLDLAVGNTAVAISITSCWLSPCCDQVVNQLYQRDQRKTMASSKATTVALYDNTPPTPLLAYRVHNSIHLHIHLYVN